MSSAEPDRVNILGVGISAINMGQALEIIDDWIATREPHYICVTPAHGVMDCHAEPELRQIFNSSGLTTPDGMSIVWLLRLHGKKHVSRVYGPDLMQAVCERSSSRGYRHFLYGGAEGVAEALRDRLSAACPGLRIVGTHCPPFRELTPEEDQDVVRRIDASGADVVWVGISTPKQERWMARNVGRLNAPVLIGVGAAFDFLSGRKRQAPRWMQRSGLEWLFRLMTEPRRLWRRYARYPVFALLVLGQALGLSRYPLNGASISDGAQ